MKKFFKIVFGGLLVLIILGGIIGALRGGADTTKESDSTDKQIETSAEPQENAETDNEPQWGEVTYGSVDALKSTVTNQNGTSGIQIGDSTPITDMAANAEVTVKEDTPMQTDTTSANSTSKSSYMESIQYAYELKTVAGEARSYTIGLQEARDAWDNELNRIYGLLRKKLSPQKMDTLKQEELAWIKSRDKEVGDPEVVGVWTALESHIYLTQERTLYLIDMYFDEKKEAPSDDSNNYYVIPDSHYNYLAYDDIYRLSKHELLLARNEIYARHGYVFKSNDLQNYFNNQYWYYPDPSYDGSLSSLEKANVDFIKSYE